VAPERLFSTQAQAARLCRIVQVCGCTVVCFQWDSVVHCAGLCTMHIDSSFPERLVSVAHRLLPRLVPLSVSPTAAGFARVCSMKMQTKFSLYLADSVYFARVADARTGDFDQDRNVRSEASFVTLCSLSRVHPLLVPEPFGILAPNRDLVKQSFLEAVDSESVTGCLHPTTGVFDFEFPCFSPGQTGRVPLPGDASPRL